MATDLERLVVSLDADISRLTKQLAKAGFQVGDFAQKADRQTKEAAKKIGDNLAEATGKVGGLGFQQGQILGHSVRATVEAITAGANPLKVIAQEGVKAAAAVGEDGLGGLLKRTAVSAARFVTPATAAGAAVAALGGTALYAASSFETMERRIKLGLTGIGAASGATVNDIREIGAALAHTQGVSVSTGENIALALAKTGKLDVSRIPEIASQTRGLAALTGKSMDEAGSMLAELYADPKGAEKWDALLGTIDAKTKSYMSTLQQQGRAQEAISVLAKAVVPQLQHAADETGHWTNAWNGLKAAAEGYFESFGRHVVEMGNGPSLDDQIKAAEARLATAKAGAGRSGLFSLGGALGETGPDAEELATIKAIEAEIAELTARRQKDRAEAEKTAAEIKTTSASKVIQTQIDAIDHEAAALRALGNAIEAFKQAMAVPGAADKVPGGADTVNAALGAMQQKYATLRTEFAEGGQAAKEALAQADFEAKTAGVSSYAKAVASVVHEYERAREAAKGSLNFAATDTSLQKVRDQQLEALRTDYLAKPSSYAHGMGDVPAQYRDLFFSSAATAGLDPNLLAAVAHRESRFNPKAVSPAGAKGLMQLMPDTASDLGVSNTFDPDQSVPAGAKMLARLIKKYNGDVGLALAAYNWGAGNVDAVRQKGGSAANFPKETRTYVSDIMQAPADFEKQADLVKGYDQQLADAKKQVEALADANGDATARLDKVRLAQQMVNETIRASGTINDADRAAIQARADALVDLQQKLAAAQLKASIAFETGELGRTPDQQQVDQQLNGAGIARGSAEGRALEEQMTRLQRLASLKADGGEFLKGLTHSLIEGKGAAAALADEVQRLAEKLADKAIDTLLAAVFTGGPGGSGGLLGSLGSVLHLAGGGPVHGPGSGTSDSIPAMLSAGEFVIPADVMRRHGGLIQAVYAGRVPRFAAGGPVGRLIAPPTAVAARQGGDTEIVIHNNNGSQVSAKSHWSPDMHRQVQIMVDDAFMANVQGNSRGVRALVKRGFNGVGGG